MDGPLMAGITLIQQLKRADDGQNLNPAADRPRAVSHPTQLIGRYVCTPAWAPRPYPPRADCARTRMVSCEGKACGARQRRGGRIYPFYYVALVEPFPGMRSMFLCYDCWQIVMRDRERALDAWYARQPGPDHGTTESASAAAIRASAEMLLHDEDGNLCEVGILEADMLPESAAALSSEIASGSGLRRDAQ